MKRVGQWLSTSGAVTLVIALWSATPAAAHTPSAVPSCTGLAVQMANYPGPGTPNRVTITVDATVVLDTMFGETYSTFVAWSDRQSHTWKVVVDDIVPDGDATFSGVQEACVVTTSSEAVVTTTTEAVTTTSAEELAAPTTVAAPTSSEATTTTSTVSLAAAATTTSTTAIASFGPAPVGSSPTPVVAPAVPVVATQVGSAGGVAAVGGAQDLPATGADRTIILVAGSIATLLGVALVVTARRRVGDGTA